VAEHGTGTATGVDVTFNVSGAAQISLTQFGKTVRLFRFSPIWGYDREKDKIIVISNG
jgi:hypothetical protein